VCVAARGSAIGRRQARDYPAAKALVRVEVSTQLRRHLYDRSFCYGPQRDALAPAHDRGDGELPGYFGSQKMIYAASLNVDRSINRAVVAGCAISATRNYLKLHMPKTLNPLSSNLHAKTQKLWTHSAMRVGAFRPHAESANCPLMDSAFPPRCPPRSTPTSPRAGAIPSIEGDANPR
jgi:hypothetical protein